MTLRDDHYARFTVDTLATEGGGDDGRGDGRVGRRVFESRPAPCVGCTHSELCTAELLACRTFRTWVHSPYSVDYEAERVPTREHYEKAFREDDEDMQGQWLRKPSEEAANEQGG